jgi:hypothetical protein
MNNEINNQEPEQTGIDLWKVEFQALMNEARKRELFAPDILVILQRTAVEIQHQINCILFTHEHKVNQDQGE